MDASNAESNTIQSHLNGRSTYYEHDVLVIDECSTVTNASLLKVLESTSFELLVGSVRVSASIRLRTDAGTCSRGAPRGRSKSEPRGVCNTVRTGGGRTT